MIHSALSKELVEGEEQRDSGDVFFQGLQGWILLWKESLKWRMRISLQISARPAPPSERDPLETDIGTEAVVRRLSWKS